MVAAKPTGGSKRGVPKSASASARTASTRKKATLAGKKATTASKKAASANTPATRTRAVAVRKSAVPVRSRHSHKPVSLWTTLLDERWGWYAITAGVFLEASGLIIDIIMHRLDAKLPLHDLFSFASPAHILLSLGVFLIITGSIFVTFVSGYLEQSRSRMATAAALLLFGIGVAIFTLSGASAKPAAPGMQHGNPSASSAPARSGNPQNTENPQSSQSPQTPPPGRTATPAQPASTPAR